MCIALYRVDIVGHIKNITSIAGCKHKTVTLKLTLTHNPDRYRRRCPDPNARIQKTEDVQIKTETTKLRLRKIWRCMFLILPDIVLPTRRNSHYVYHFLSMFWRRLKTRWRCMAAFPWQVGWMLCRFIGRCIMRVKYYVYTQSTYFRNCTHHDAV